ncbi:MAG: CbiQ family ECF transporter T component [Rhodocyclaceae bacterium]
MSKAPANCSKKSSTPVAARSRIKPARCCRASPDLALLQQPRRSFSACLHPAVFIAAGCVILALLQSIDGALFHIALACATLAALGAQPARWWRLVKRVRFIALALAVLFLWQTPGTLVWPALGAWSPTYDGVWLGLDRILRLVAVVDVVVLLMRLLDTEQWVAGLYALGRPVRWLGVSPERFAVRLNLVLQAADAPTRRDWRYWLADAVAPQTDASWHIPLLRARDRCVIVLVFAAGIGAMWWRG